MLNLSPLNHWCFTSALTFRAIRNNSSLLELNPKLITELICAVVLRRNNLSWHSCLQTSCILEVCTWYSYFYFCNIYCLEQVIKEVEGEAVANRSKCNFSLKLITFDTHWWYFITRYPQVYLCSSCGSWVMLPMVSKRKFFIKRPLSQELPYSELMCGFIGKSVVVKYHQLQLKVLIGNRVSASLQQLPPPPSLRVNNEIRKTLEGERFSLWH